MDLVLDFLTSAVALFSILLFYYLFLYSSYNVSHSKEAPIVEGAWPILGHLPLLRSSQALHNVLWYSAIGAKECFTKIDSAISTRPKLDATQHLANNGAMFVLAPYGPYWRQVRKITNSEVLAHRRVEQLKHFCVLEVQTSIKELFNVWCSKKNESSNYVLVDLQQWFTQLSFNSVLPMMVGKRYFGVTNVIDKEEAERCIKALKEMMYLFGVFTMGDAIPFLKWFDFGGHVKAMKKTSKELNKILGELLDEHRHNRSLSANVERDHQDFMDVMLSLLDGKETIEGFDSDTTIKGTILTMIAGGTDTTSVTLTWAICLLLRNPLTLEKAKEELDTQVGKERCVRQSDIDKLVYLQAIVKETLRLYPADPFSVPREFSENCNLGGYNVRKGTRLILNLWRIHTDPNVWSDSLEFKPERFLTTHKDVCCELLEIGSK